MTQEFLLRVLGDEPVATTMDVLTWLMHSKALSAQVQVQRVEVRSLDYVSPELPAKETGLWWRPATQDSVLKKPLKKRQNCGGR